ncbi:MAG: sarcosine oxidase subunit alpha family protein [Rhodospirillales bacterium]|jgi:sarcosine oxidase, subunit alpha|nr:sarcosine oxidase subunit alpha family protein [Rhodospirillales bacterium]MBT4040933.1 sarcosine oxidase subunit alpha family protein [Rhodospirillales bacterium]MBT4625792.1 sarcosine oxidase subunit alpha family protein [Rhodospirillales bacterium]MBT5351507.1 sarcosine oxidase subunit alpha family protein [Rhodospirillales bacterium]MBT6111320.1 sarcosine oxidase subunit alpha family protein [Rhodospirillales bacterium]
MSQSYRLESGGKIDRAKPLSFTFNGKSYGGYQGDTLASALIANGVKLVGRSFKYHRPRGFLSAGSDEPNAVVQLEEGAYTDPNTRATVVELYDGLKAASQNCWPSVNHDVGEINSLFARFLPAGFYYKTFMWPPKLWMWYEERIRHAAGMGVSPMESDPDKYENLYTHCDVLIAGGGPAGLAAALTAGRTGARVIIADEQDQMGGALLSSHDEIDGKPAMVWVEETLAELATMPEVRILPRTTVTGYYDYNWLTALEKVTDHKGPGNGGDSVRQRFWKIRAKQVVLATGAIERPLVFAENDRPGIMMASAVRTYINRYGVLPGKEILVFANNDSGYLTAIDAIKAGARVYVADVRANPQGDLVKQAEALGVKIYRNTAITGTRGRKAVTGAEVMELNEDGTDVVGSHYSIDCDIIAMAGGWNPTVHLFSQSRGKLRWDEAATMFVPKEGVAINPSRSVGCCNGTMNLGAVLAEGLGAGVRAARDAGFGDGSAPEAPTATIVAEEPVRAMWEVPCHGHKKKFHEFQNDSTSADLQLATREGMLSVEHTKRYTTTGMGTDQGKTSNVTGLGIMAAAQNRGIPAVGTTTFRPPYTPQAFGAITGQNRRELFEQNRTTSMQPWHESHGAVFEDVGDWKRPWYFPKPGESMHDAVQRECKATRDGVGIMDASTLGKIDIQGPDSLQLLEMLYTNAWAKLGIGRCRYGVMLNEHGMIFDDGVTTRLGENHFHMTTTTGGAARVMGWLEEWLQTEWPDMQVYCTSVTEQWAVATISGPRARALLSELTDIDLDVDSLPFMGMTEGNVAGVPARVYRISFTGEVAFEINVPQAHGLHLWETLMALGEKYDICPYGTETMHVLRAEKGFIIVGQDTDGTCTPMDVGMDWIVSKKKEDFLGKRSFSRSDNIKGNRKELVGLLTEDPKIVLPEGAHIAAETDPKPAMGKYTKAAGHVTSSYMTPNITGPDGEGRSIALAVLRNGQSRHGETITVPLMDGRMVKALVTEPIFFDKEGERTRG